MKCSVTEESIAEVPICLSSRAGGGASREGAGTAMLPKAWRVPYYGKLANRSTKNPHIVPACNLPGLFRCEAAAQHRCDEMNPLPVVLHTPRRDMLVGTDADVIDAN